MHAPHQNFVNGSVGASPAAARDPNPTTKGTRGAAARDPNPAETGNQGCGRAGSQSGGNGEPGLVELRSMYGGVLLRKKGNVRPGERRNKSDEPVRWQ